MNKIFDLITKLRVELETCRNGNNDTQVFDAMQTLNEVDNMLLKQVENLSLGVVMPSLLEEEKLEPIQNALYATMQMTTDQATDIAEGILTYIKDHCYDIIKTNEA